jgi:hypothetical protein
VLVLVREECSLLESPLGELSFEFEEDDECSLVVELGAIGAGATYAGTGATTTGATYTTAGAGGDELVVVSVDLKLDVSVESAKATAPPKSIPIPKDKTAVINECFTMIASRVFLRMCDSIQE